MVTSSCSKHPFAISTSPRYLRNMSNSPQTCSAGHGLGVNATPPPSLVADGGAGSTLILDGGMGHELRRRGVVIKGPVGSQER